VIKIYYKYIFIYLYIFKINIEYVEHIEYAVQFTLMFNNKKWKCMQVKNFYFNKNIYLVFFAVHL